VGSKPDSVTPKRGRSRNEAREIAATDLRGRMKHKLPNKTPRVRPGAECDRTFLFLGVEKMGS
jgi:hypothetical protein